MPLFLLAYENFCLERLASRSKSNPAWFLGGLLPTSVEVNADSTENTGITVEWPEIPLLQTQPALQWA